MRLPFLPVVFDNFRPAPGVCVYFLSHFHTDHLIGLTPSWAAGVIYCSPITRGLLLDRFRLPVDRVVALTPGATRTIPFARDIHHGSLTASKESQWNPSRGMVSSSSLSDPSDALSMRVTVFDAPHIPGSMMIHLSTCLGTYLYTGDFRLTLTDSKPLNPSGFLEQMESTDADAAQTTGSQARRRVQGKLPVDHLIVDDTWLHLTPSHPGFLTEEEVIREFQRITETINRSLGIRGGVNMVVAPAPCGPVVADHTEMGEADEQHHDEPVLGPQLDTSSAAIAAEPTQEQLQPRQQPSTPDLMLTPSEAVAPSGHTPSECDGPLDEESKGFCLRVYLHNHFGKETILQELAKRLEATIVVDERRYNYLSTIVHSELEQQQFAQRRGEETTIDAIPSTFQPSGIDLSLFTTASRHGRLAGVGHQDADCVFELVTEPFPQRAIQVVPSRAWITPQSIRQARDQTGVPHFGLIMSGWAGVQKRAQLQAEAVPDVILWRLPYSLHCTPKELCGFVEAIRPLSIQSLHHSNAGDNERGLILLKKCGRYLVSPGYNQPVSATVAMQKLPLSLMKTIYATNTAQNDPLTLRGGARDDLHGRKRERDSDELDDSPELSLKAAVGVEGRRGVRIRSAERSDDEGVDESDWKSFDELLAVGVGPEVTADCHPSSDLSVLSLLDRETSPCREERTNPSHSQCDSISDLSLLLSGVQTRSSNLAPIHMEDLLPFTATTVGGSQSEPRVLSAVANFERSLEGKRCSIVL